MKTVPGTKCGKVHCFVKITFSNIVRSRMKLVKPSVRLLVCNACIPFVNTEINTPPTGKLKTHVLNFWLAMHELQKGISQAFNYHSHLHVKENEVNTMGGISYC